MNKYRNVRTEYNGVMYDSKFESIVAKELDLLIKAKNILSYTRQTKFDIVVNDSKICFYKADFVVNHLDESREIIEAKGKWTDVAKIKIKLVYVLYPLYKITIMQKHQSYTFEGKFIK